jgi:hypothetical protein
MQYGAQIFSAIIVEYKFRNILIVKKVCGVIFCLIMSETIRIVEKLYWA